jgi:hypothetical protein
MNDRFFIDLLLNQSEFEGMVTLGKEQMLRLYQLAERGINRQAEACNAARPFTIYLPADEPRHE